MNDRARRSALILGLLASSSCSASEVAGTQVLVEIEADPAVAAALKVVQARWYAAGEQDEAKVAGELRLPLAPQPIASGSTTRLVLGSFGIAKGRDSQFKLAVLGFESADAAAAPLIEQKALVSFQDERKVVVRMTLSAACWQRARECTALDRTCAPAAMGVCAPLAELVPVAVAPLAPGDSVDASMSSSDTLGSDAGTTQTAPTGETGRMVTPISPPAPLPGATPSPGATPPATNAAPNAPITPSTPAPTTTPTAPTTTPTAPTTAPIASTGTLAASAFHVCAVRADATVSCWGHNGEGGLGTGDRVSSNLPRTVLGLSNVVEIAGAAGGGHTCARRRDGSVFCWGLNHCGQLGDGTVAACSDSGGFSTVPLQVPGLTDAVRIAAGYYHTCAIKRDGTVVCWGGFGGSLPSQSAPTLVPGVSNAVDIAVGASNFAVRRGDGAVLCWGGNGTGRVGNGTPMDSATPVAVVGLSDPVQLIAGNNHVCGLSRDGSTLCWGFGAALGVDAWTPTRHAGLPAATRLAGQQDGTCAALRGGGITCVGDNALTPTPLPGEITEVTGGVSHACARTTGGSIWCWGSNTLGQLGDGTLVDRRNTLTPVIGF
ncbi:MAG: hypothetical protein ABW252_11620 [Polyangiales bacterium]